MAANSNSQRDGVRAFVPAAVIAVCIMLPLVRGVMPAVVAAVYATAFATRSGRGVVDVAAGTEGRCASLDDGEDVAGADGVAGRDADLFARCPPSRR